MASLSGARAADLRLDHLIRSVAGRAQGSHIDVVLLTGSQNQQVRPNRESSPAAPFKGLL
jgi:hypothetical protein